MIKNDGSRLKVHAKHSSSIDNEIYSQLRADLFDRQQSKVSFGPSSHGPNTSLCLDYILDAALSMKLQSLHAEDSHQLFELLVHVKCLTWMDHRSGNACHRCQRHATSAQLRSSITGALIKIYF